MYKQAAYTVFGFRSEVNTDLSALVSCGCILMFWLSSVVNTTSGSISNKRPMGLMHNANAQVTYRQSAICFYLNLARKGNRLLPNPDYYILHIVWLKLDENCGSNSLSQDCESQIFIRFALRHAVFTMLRLLGFSH